MPGTSPGLFKPSLSALSVDKLAALDGSWTVRRLENGLRLMVLPNPHNDHFYLGAIIGSGARWEQAPTIGVSHFLEHMMFRGSEQFPEFKDLAAAFEWLGGDWNAETGHDHTEYWYSGITATAKHALPLFADFLIRPKLANLEVEREIIQREIEGEINEFGNWTDLDLHMADLLWPQSNIAKPILGSKESVAAMTGDQLRAHMRQHYRADNTVICVVAGGDPAEWCDLLAQHFQEFPMHPSPGNLTPLPAMQGPRAKWVEDSDSEVAVMLSFRTPHGEFHDEAHDYELIERMLGDGFCSRLFLRLREELGLVYDVSASATLHPDTGTFDIVASMHPDRLSRYLEELCGVIRGLCEHGVQPDELQRAQLRSLVDLDLSPSELEDVGSRVAWALLNDQQVSYCADHQAVLERTPAGVTAVCQRLFDQKNAGLVLLGPGSHELARKMESLLRRALPS